MPDSQQEDLIVPLHMQEFLRIVSFGPAILELSHTSQTVNRGRSTVCSRTEPLPDSDDEASNFLP